MIHFAWPWMLLLLPLPWLHFQRRRAAEPRGVALFVPFLSAITAANPRHADSNRRAQICYAVIWILLVLAATRPQWLGEPLPVPSTGRKLLLALDASGSMATQDMANGASRLQVVKEVAGRFIDQRHGDQVGLILFGTQPYLQAPLTPDLTTVHRFLDEAVVGIAGTETAIGDAIGLALKRLRAAQSDDQRDDGDSTKTTNATHQTILILLTDGQNTAGVMPPLEAARLAAQQGLRIYTIGVGAVAQQGFFGISGNADLDEDTLTAIAKATGGQYFRAADAQTLQRVYQRINELEPAAGREQWLRPADEWFTVPLALALLCSVPATWFGARRWT